MLRPEVIDVKPGHGWMGGGFPWAHNSPMLYKLKSKAAGDLILLEPQGKQLLTLIGKRPEAQGIIAPEEMLDAMEALRQAIAKQEADQAQAQADAKAQGQPAPRFEDIGLRQRCKPFMDMLARCHKAGQPIVWGVP